MLRFPAGSTSVLPPARSASSERRARADVADHAGPLEPGRIDLPAAVEAPQLRRTRRRRGQRVEHQLGGELADVGHAAVEQAERAGDVEGQRFEAGQERVGLRRAEP
jgi:hypothetical protein